MEAGRQEKMLSYEKVFENTTDIIFMVEVTKDHRFKLLEANPAWEKATGLKCSEVTGRCMEDIILPENARRAFQQYQCCIKTAAAIDYEEQLIVPGGLRDYHTTLTPLYNGEGRIHRLFGIARDITRRRQAEALLKQREQEFRTLAENSPEPIYRYDRNCVRLYVNPVVGKILGKSVEELIASSPSDGRIPSGL